MIMTSFLQMQIKCSMAIIVIIKIFIIVDAITQIVCLVDDLIIPFFIYILCDLLNSV